MSYPQVVWGLTDLPIIFGENVTLFCNTTSIQENHVTWMKESDVIVHHGLVFYRSKFAEYSVSEGSFLTIINANVNDFGVSYTCIADIFSFDSLLDLDVLNLSSKGPREDLRKEKSNHKILLVVLGILALVLLQCVLSRLITNPKQRQKRNCGLE